MDIRQQVTLTADEVKKIIVDHLRRSGLRISQRNINMERDGNFRALTMSEDEIYLADTKVLLEKPISQLELTNKKLKEKILKLSSKGAVLGDLICNKIERSHSKDNFLLRNTLEDFLFTRASDKKDLINSKDEDELIEVFGKLGIKLNKRQ